MKQPQRPGNTGRPARRLAAGILLSVVFAALVPDANARRHHDRREREHARDAVANCYDASDPTEIRLWEGRAPGAAGDDPCRDVPFMKMYAAAADGRATHAAILVIPGGGYDRLTDRKEQGPVGLWFSQHLHAATFVLFYRLVQADGTYRYPTPMWDGQRALKLIRSRAAQFSIDPERVGVFGFSAGGHLASTLALHSASDFHLPQHDAVDGSRGRPSFLGLGYPVISMLPDEYASPNSLAHLLFGYEGGERERLEHYLSGQLHVTPHTPPVFLFESLDDQRISPRNSVIFAQALRAGGIPAEVHLFRHGVHGAGLAEGIPEEEAWPEMFHQWFERQAFSGQDAP